MEARAAFSPLSPTDERSSPPQSSLSEEISKSQRPPLPQLDVRDQELLNSVQESFPLATWPYRALGERLDMSEAEVMDRMRRLVEEGVIRQTGAIFDTRALGYKSSLIAMQTDKARSDEAAEVLNAHPGISHNYLRNHEFNIWFTLAVPPYKDLEEEMNTLARQAGAIKTWLLPNLELYKIGVSLDMTGKKDLTRKDESFGQRELQSGGDITLADVRAIRELQRDLPIEPRPFLAEAEALGITEAELFAKADELQRRKKMRRFASILHHRKAGYKANPMAVWNVPLERATEVGQIMASYAAVSHCYRRPIYPDWKYSHYTMIHGRNAPDCRAIAEAISQETGIEDYLLLFSTKEYKKTRVEYFTEDDWPVGYFE
jgi:DNA-binding Lrp family transcriptional regulator